jgi:hypothetical protein
MGIRDFGRMPVSWMSLCLLRCYGVTVLQDPLWRLQLRQCVAQPEFSPCFDAILGVQRVKNAVAQVMGN